MPELHKHVCLVISDSLRPYRLQPCRLLCPWDSPAKNARVDCHFLLQGIFPTHQADFFTTEPPALSQSACKYPFIFKGVDTLPHKQTEPASDTSEFKQWVSISCVLDRPMLYHPGYPVTHSYPARICFIKLLFHLTLGLSFCFPTPALNFHHLSLETKTVSKKH